MNDTAEQQHWALRGAAAYNSAFKTMDIWASSTGFRTHPFRLRTLSHSKDERLAEQFLLNTRLAPRNRPEAASIAEYFSDIGVTLLSLVDRGWASGRPTLALPESTPLQMSLEDVLKRRRSSRCYTGDPIQLADLAALCRAAAAVTGVADVTLATGGHAEILYRSAPSGGGLYSVRLFAAALTVSDLNKGLYGYDPVQDQLVTFGEASTVDKVLDSFSVPRSSLPVDSAAVVFLLVGRPWRAMRKYGNRGARLMLMETGALAEHIALASTALGLGSLDCSSVYDEQVHRALEIDGTHEMLLHTVVVGSAA